ncbi:MAG: YdcF family protein [Burkholderiaceae bacterium]|nr:YdcF family protein [Burkholderiaceae bacterium]
MNDLFVLLGIQSWKPVLTALALPPLPWILLMLVGARMMFWRRSVSWLLLLLGAAGLWLSCTSAVGHWLERAVLKPPPALAPDRITEVKRIAETAGYKVAIVVLGGGREAMAPEYGLANLIDLSLQRLHYGVWVSRQIGAPMLFSGGVGHVGNVGVAEAEVAARIAEKDYGRPLTWTEAESRDTRENASRSMALLKTAGITDIVLVTHGFHMPRSMRAFQSEAQRAGVPMRVWPAPMGLAAPSERPLLRWLPSSEGFQKTRMVLRELMGLLVGA